MIIQCAHLTCVCSDLPAADTWVRQQGYRRLFIESQLPNPIIKTPFFSRPLPTHDLSVYQKNHSLSLELISYAHPAMPVSSMIPVFTGALAEQKDICQTVTLGGELYSRYDVPAVSSSVYHVGSSEGAVRCQDVVLGCVNVQQSIDLWSQVGFTLEQKREDSAVMVFHSVIAKEPLTILLVSEPVSGRFADTPGVAGLAFITSAIGAERERFVQLGYDVTAIESLVVNGKKVHLFFIHGPQQELIEIIGI